MASWFWQLVDVNGVILGSGTAYDQAGAADQVRACLANYPMVQTSAGLHHRLTFKRVS